MKLFLFLLGLWGVGDAIWLAFRPQQWSNWWGRWILRMGVDRTASKAYALVEFVLSLGFIAWAIGRVTSANEEISATLS